MLTLIRFYKGYTFNLPSAILSIYLLLNTENTMKYSQAQRMGLHAEVGEINAHHITHAASKSVVADSVAWIIWRITRWRNHSSEVFVDSSASCKKRTYENLAMLNIGHILNHTKLPENRLIILTGYLLTITEYLMTEQIMTEHWLNEHLKNEHWLSCSWCINQV